MPDPLHVVTVGGFVANAAGEVLLVNVAERGWEMPGGRVEEGEGLATALGRELLEETGCTATVEALVGLYSRVDRPFMLLSLFRCRHLSGSPTPSDPAIAEAGWFSVEAARALVTQPASCERLADALRAGPTVVKTYRTSPYEVVSATVLDGVDR